VEWPGRDFQSEGGGVGERMERREGDQGTDREKSERRSSGCFVLEEVNREQGSFG